MKNYSRLHIHPTPLPSPSSPLLTFTPDEQPVSGSLSVLSDFAKSPKYESAQSGTPHSAIVTVLFACVYCDDVTSAV